MTATNKSDAEEYPFCRCYSSRSGLLAAFEMLLLLLDLCSHPYSVLSRDITWVLAKVVFNNKAMVYAGAGVCAVIGTLSPVCTAVISSCCGRRLTVPCYVLCIGVFVVWQ